jgi:ProP effector
MTEVAPPIPRRQQNPILETLVASFKVFGDCLPLAIGIHKLIKERLPELDAQQLKATMRLHTSSTRYLKVLSQADTRFDLDGAPAGEVTAEQRQQALDTLRDRFRKKAEQHKAEQLAKQQQEKLQQLAAKFNAR